MSNETSHIVVLKTYDVPQLAHLDKAKLDDEGIESFVQDDNIVSMAPFFGTAVGGVKLLVIDADMERARKVLAINEYDLLNDSCPEQLDPQGSCPNCGSTDIIQRNSVLAGILHFIMVGLPLSVPTNKWFCPKCGHRWKQP